MDDIARHPNVLAVEAALRAAGITPQVRVLPHTAPTAAAAAEQLGCPVAAIANSLIFDAAGSPLLVLTSGAHRVDTGKVPRTSASANSPGRAPTSCANTPASPSAASPRSAIRPRSAR